MDYALTFDDVLLVPAYNHYLSRKEVDISNTDKTGRIKLELPVLTSNMDTITGHKMAKYIRQKGGMGVLHRFMSILDNVKEYKKYKNVFVSIGTNGNEKERFQSLRTAGANKFCVDVAHGHAKYTGQMIKYIRDEFPEAIIMAGNVSTYAGADYLASVGADLIKVGIGPGSACTTRIKTGFGVPQLTAIKDCARVGRSIVADGGIRYPGDIVKALAFGADFVMIGGMLAGTHPTPGEVKDYGKKVYRGMASKEVAEENGGLTEWKTAEGVSFEVMYKTLEETDIIVKDIIGGLRSGLTYAGAINISELQRKLNYVVITNAGRIENTAHGDRK
jgi:IMP dehydrogenase